MDYKVNFRNSWYNMTKIEKEPILLKDIVYKKCLPLSTNKDNSYNHFGKIIDKPENILIIK